MLLAIDEDYYRQLALLRERNAQAEREKIYENVGAWADALGSMSNMFGAFQDVIIAGYGDNTEAGRKAARQMFVMQQALAVGQATLSMFVAIGKAMELGYPLSIPATVAAVAHGGANIAAIMATTIAGVADAGLATDALRAAGLNQHTAIGVRNDEMVSDPVGTKYITEMLAIQKSQMLGEGERTIVTTVELDGHVLGTAVDKRLIRQQERGIPYHGRVRQGYLAV